MAAVPLLLHIADWAYISRDNPKSRVCFWPLYRRDKKPNLFEFWLNMLFLIELNIWIHVSTTYQAQKFALITYNLRKILKKAAKSSHSVARFCCGCRQVKHHNLYFVCVLLNMRLGNRGFVVAEFHTPDKIEFRVNVFGSILTLKIFRSKIFFDHSVCFDMYFMNHD